MQITHRDGSQSEYDIQKIRDVIKFACQGLHVNPIQLENGVTSGIHDGITTSEIQDSLLLHAISLCSPEWLDWRYVAGRLHMWAYWKTIKAKRTSPRYSNFYDVVQDKIKNGIYTNRINEAYTAHDLVKASSWINPELDNIYDYAGAILLTKRYLLEDELPQEAFLVCALLLAAPEKEDVRMYYAEHFYYAIAEHKISLATPLLANIRTPSRSLSSCFITAMDDNLESIFETITNVARISKNGGGVGVNVSRVRASGSEVMGKQNASSGVLPWIKLLNDTAIAVNQGGLRAGAVTVSLDIWHLDVLEFLDCQTEHGDQRRKAYDIFPQLVIPDEFMRRVERDEMWTLIDPCEAQKVIKLDLAKLWGHKFEHYYERIESVLGSHVRLYKQVKARDLFKQIMRTQIETGMPYLAFKDTINEANPNQHIGYIPGVNLCCESFSNVEVGETAHCCNLASLNLANLMVSDFEKYVSLAVRMLDNSLELTHPPFDAAKNHNDKYRTIGLGLMGLADFLAKNKLTYKHTNIIAGLMEEFVYEATHASMELAKERGAYPAFKHSQWESGFMLGNKSLAQIKDKSKFVTDEWEVLARNIKKYGIRNSHITAIAPNTSSALIQGCTSSILPPFSRFFYDKSANGAVPIAPPYARDYWNYYRELTSIHPSEIVEVVSMMQFWVDTGISMELMFNLNQGVYFADEPTRSLTAVDIYEVLMDAWKKKIKAVYYIRTVQKDDFGKKAECSSCAN